jgi:hypothetical protein
MLISVFGVDDIFVAFNLRLMSETITIADAGLADTVLGNKN